MYQFSDEIYPPLAAEHEKGKADNKAFILELISDAEGVHSEAWVNGLKAALDRVEMVG